MSQKHQAPFLIDVGLIEEWTCSLKTRTNQTVVALGHGCQQEVNVKGSDFLGVLSKSAASSLPANWIEMKIIDLSLFLLFQ